MEVAVNALEIKQRRGLIVWLYSLRQVKQLRRFGYVHSVSKKMKYALVYVNEVQIEQVMNKLMRLHFVRTVELSYRPDLPLNFSERIGTDEAYPSESKKNSQIELIEKESENKIN